jgi:alanine racemase
VGKVSMDTLAIDLTLHPRIGPGQWATLWGTSGLPVEHIALAAGTIAAQLLTGLTARVPRQLARGA